MANPALWGKHRAKQTAGGIRLPSQKERRVNYEQVFDSAIDRLHSEGRYRVFIDILRNKGAFPNARCFAGHNGPKPITVWC